MRAAVFAGPGELVLEEVPTPSAGPGEIVLRVGANTVCGTDGRILRGEKTAGIDKGVVLGHEIAGYVTEVGEGVDGFAEGDLVGVLPTVPCLKCYYCRHGQEHLCIDSDIFGYSFDGGLADYIKIPRAAMERGGVYKVEADLEPVEVALAEPLGCVINGASNYRPGLGDTVVIMGAGPIGLLHTQLNKHLGASRIIVSDPNQKRCELALELGATHAVNPLEVDLRDFVMGLTEGRGADVIVICIGRPELLQDTFKIARKGAHINAFAGFQKGVLAQVDPNLLHYGEFTVTGASNAGRSHHAMALKLISEGAINVKKLHTHTFPLSKVRDGIEFACSGEGVKVAIVPDSEYKD
ncbi:MAG TPA: alcohol dehydrogenase catalytic domain-containing protein [Actinomyces sp.]|jgi:L-iditol 2-dehydrogenase|nr:alcohol dehydrogenase catalytic domain-containing protein [Acidobacteriota bacterium]HHT40345.1 alcohol dehydrogenase catalytic domain-containing protein [Actinomyces sp.]